MAKLLGNDYRLWVESTTPGTFNTIAGQQDLAQNSQAQTIDTSSKDDFPYATQAPGMRTCSITCGLIPDLPDATGYSRLETLANAAAATPFNVQIRKGGSSGADPDDVVFEGSVYCTDFPKNYAQNDAVKVNFTLVIAAAPTADTLA